MTFFLHSHKLRHIRTRISQTQPHSKAEHLIGLPWPLRHTREAISQLVQDRYMPIGYDMPFLHRTRPPVRLICSFVGNTMTDDCSSARRTSETEIDRDRVYMFRARRRRRKKVKKQTLKVTCISLPGKMICVVVEVVVEI